MKPPSASILIVDDEPKALNLLRNLLEVEGYRVTSAASGPEALAAARQLPDLVLLDLMMPGMDGYEVCQKLRAEPAHALVPIIMLTALDDRASRLRGLHAGADDFLSKPFDAAELRARVRTITRLNRYRGLYEERARFEAAIAHAPEGIVLAELDGTIIHRNNAFTALLDPAGASLANFFAYLPADTALALRAETTGSATRPKAGREVALGYARRPETVVEINHSLIPWEGRGIVQFHLRDLTERKALETQLFHSQRIELLGQLAGSVVHDMNNILTAIGGSAMLIEMDPGRDLAPQLHNIQTSVQRGSAVLRQLLMFARGADATLTEASPVLPVAEVVDLVRETFGRRFTVEFKAESGLPFIALDQTQMHQVVMNLCVNARDAMPEGGRLDISLGRRQVSEAEAGAAGLDARPGDYIVLAVRDQGTGIPPEVVPKLFDPFFTTKPVGKGTGLGLATVMRVLKRHGGFVRLETAIGTGTCFFCHFPVQCLPGVSSAAAVMTREVA